MHKLITVKINMNEVIVVRIKMVKPTMNKFYGKTNYEKVNYG